MGERKYRAFYKKGEWIDVTAASMLQAHKILETQLKKLGKPTKSLYVCLLDL